MQWQLLTPTVQSLRGKVGKWIMDQKSHKVLDCFCPKATYSPFPNNFSLLEIIVLKCKKKNPKQIKAPKTQPKRNKIPSITSVMDMVRKNLTR